MIRVAIVEDEDSYIAVLTDYLTRWESENQESVEITVFHDGDEIASNYSARFDIILMDIEMRFINGMTAAEEIRRQDASVCIIFITNAPQYAIRGYEVGALDYILKPVSYFTFSQKFRRAAAKVKKRSQKRWITIQTKGGFVRKELGNLYYIESEGHCLLYHGADGTIRSSGTMKSAEETMAGADFFRINKCYLVNLEHVDGVQDKFALVHGEKLLISRPRLKGFMQDLTRYWGERS